MQINGPDGNEQERRRLKQENVRLDTLLNDFWRLSLVIESAVRRAEGQDSAMHKHVVGVILATQEFYKSRGQNRPTPNQST